MDNIVVIVIDRLSYNQIVLDSDESNLNPTIQSLAANGINCTNVFAHGCPTQFAMPPVFTSTLPLDYGGYDDGIATRPVSVFEHLSGHGYETVGMVSGLMVSSFYGYDRGFNEFYFLGDLDVFWYHLTYLVNHVLLIFMMMRRLLLHASILRLLIFVQSRKMKKISHLQNIQIFINTILKRLQVG